MYLYEQIKETCKLSFILANESELLDLQFTQKYFSRKKIENYDIHDNEKDNQDTQFILSKMKPLLTGFTFNYLGNYTLGFIPKINLFPHNSDITFISQIGPGEIKDNKLYAYETGTYFFDYYLSCKTKNIYNYISWGSNEKYDEFLYNYPSVINKTISITNFSNFTKSNNVILAYIDLFKKSEKYNELYSLPINICFAIQALKSLRKNGTLYYFYAAIEYEQTCQFLDIIQRQFKTYEFIENSFENKNGIYKFSNYVGNEKDLQKILKKYTKLDKTLGQMYIEKKNIEPIFFDFGENYEIDNNFLLFLKNIAIKKHEMYSLFIKKVDYITELIKNPRKIQQIFDSNFEFCFSFAKKYKLEINNYYKNHLNKLNNIELKKKLFPKLHLTNDDFNSLKLSTEAIYSVSMPTEATEITKIIKYYYPNSKTIADMNANVGGNSIDFCTNFDFVYSVELDNYTSQLLKNNLDIYKFKNVEVLNMDCMNFNKKVDVHFYDPQWTGILYGLNKNISLHYEQTNVVDVLKPNFCIKVPNNYNVYELLQKFPNIHIHKVRNFMVIVNNINTTNIININKTTKKNNTFKTKQTKNKFKTKKIEKIKALLTYNNIILTKFEVYIIYIMYKTIVNNFINDIKYKINMYCKIFGLCFIFSLWILAQIMHIFIIYPIMSLMMIIVLALILFKYEIILNIINETKCNLVFNIIKANEYVIIKDDKHVDMNDDEYVVIKDDKDVDMNDDEYVIVDNELFQ